MRTGRALFASLVVGAFFGLACQPPPSTGNASISGPQDIALFDADGGLLLITSTDSDELRVLDLSKQKFPDFVRAPNPLEPLSVPVVAQPTAIARDVATGSKGEMVTGPYAYVRSAGSPEISIVSVDRTATGLSEAKRIVAPAVVTAFASRGPDPTHAYSRLYVATYDGQQATLYQSVVSPHAADGSVSTTGFQVITPAEAFRPGETVVDLLPVPGSQSLAIATHFQVSDGKTFRFAPEDSSRPSVQLGFPAPVRKLRSHWSGGTSSPAGHRIFGILDEASCYGGRACSGVYAVESIEDPNDPRLSASPPYADGARSRDWSGNEMVPLTSGTGGLIQDLQVEANALIFVPHLNPVNGQAACSASGICPADLLGSFTVSGSETVLAGGTYFFDAAQLNVIDVNIANDPTVRTLGAWDSSGNALDGGFADFGPDLSTVTLQDGLVHPEGEEIFSTYQGIIPGFTSIAVTGTTVTVLPADNITRLVDQDLMLVGTQNGCAGFEVSMTLTGTVLTLSAPLPTECTDFTKNNVILRANGSKPYVVTASKSGYLGRWGPPAANDAGVTVGFRADSVLSSSAYYHPFNFNAGASEIAFNVRAQDPSFRRDYYYEISVDSGYQADAYILDPRTFYNPPYVLPTALTYFHDTRLLLTKVYVLYPAGNRIIEIPVTDPSRWSPFSTVGITSVNAYPPF